LLQFRTVSGFVMPDQPSQLEKPVLKILAVLGGGGRVEEKRPGDRHALSTLVPACFRAISDVKETGQRARHHCSLRSSLMSEIHQSFASGRSAVIPSQVLVVLGRRRGKLAIGSPVFDGWRLASSMIALQSTQPAGFAVSLC
jgi:hypothetical protein